MLYGTERYIDPESLHIGDETNDVGIVEELPIDESEVAIDNKTTATVRLQHVPEFTTIQISVDGKGYRALSTTELNSLAGFLSVENQHVAELTEAWREWHTHLLDKREDSQTHLEVLEQRRLLGEISSAANKLEFEDEPTADTVLMAARTSSAISVAAERFDFMERVKHPDTPSARQRFNPDAPWERQPTGFKEIYRDILGKELQFASKRDED